MPDQPFVISLPDELLCIGDMAASLRDLNALAQSNKRLYAVLNRHLYKRDIKEGQYAALFWAAGNGEIKTAQLSLDAGADINVKRGWPNHPSNSKSTRTPLYCYSTEVYFENGELWFVLRSSKSYDDIIHFLFSRGADVAALNSTEPSTLYYAAVHNRSMVVVRMLLEGGMKPSNEEQTLHILVRGLTEPYHRRPNDSLEMVRLLLEHGADPNIIPSGIRSPTTALHVAVDWYDDHGWGFAVLERAKLLLEYGADVNAIYYFGYSPLRQVLRHKLMHECLVSLLIEYGADTSVYELPTNNENLDKLLRICDDISRSTGRRFEFRPSWGQTGNLRLEDLVREYL